MKRPKQSFRPAAPVLSIKPDAAELMRFQIALRKYDRLLAEWEENLRRREEALGESAAFYDDYDDDIPTIVVGGNTFMWGADLGIPERPDWPNSGCPCDGCREYARKHIHEDAPGDEVGWLEELYGLKDKRRKKKI